MSMLTSMRSHAQATLRLIIIRFYIPLEELNGEAGFDSLMVTRSPKSKV
jgi:hypothetical protein